MRKWTAINKCPSNTALCDINELVAQEVLCNSVSRGRRTSYAVNMLPE